MNHWMGLAGMFLFIVNAQAATWGYHSIERNGPLVTIFYPNYTDDQGVTFPLSVGPGGEENYGFDFCGALGFSQARPARAEVINYVDFAHPSLLIPTTRGNRFSQNAYSLIQSVFCLQPGAEASPYFESRLDHGDGTFTIVEPRFLYQNRKFFIHARDLGAGGQCILFGGRETVSARVEYAPESSQMDSSFWVSYSISGGAARVRTTIGERIDYGRVKTLTCRE